MRQRLVRVFIHLSIVLLKAQQFESGADFAAHVRSMEASVTLHVCCVGCCIATDAIMKGVLRMEIRGIRPSVAIVCECVLDSEGSAAVFLASLAYS